MLKDSLAVIGLFWGLDLKRSGSELTIANQMDLGIELQKECCRISQVRSSENPSYLCLGERRIKKQRRRKDINTLQWQYAKTFELLLQMVISVYQLSIYGAVADTIEQLPVGQRAPGKPAAPGQLDKQ